jgi:hypothetical protein
LIVLFVLCGNFAFSLRLPAARLPDGQGEAGLNVLFIKMQKPQSSQSPDSHRETQSLRSEVE